MKVTRKVDTVIIEVDFEVADKIALVLGRTIDLTDNYHQSFQPLVEKLISEAQVRIPNNLYKSGVKNGYPTIEWA
jgi:hypothetical protein